MKLTNNPSIFTRFTRWMARSCGQPVAFLGAFALVLVWVVTGPLFNYSNTWQLVINTGTTVITFLMVFVIQATQNRDSTAIHIKLDELIRTTEGAHVALLDLEEMDEDDLSKICAQYERLAAEARKALHAGKSDTGIPQVEDE